MHTILDYENSWGPSASYWCSSKRSGMWRLQLAKTSCSRANLCVCPKRGSRCGGVTFSCTSESK